MRWMRPFWLHIIEEWPAAICVVALVAIAHHWLNWLDALDGYTFVAIGNLRAASDSADVRHANSTGPNVAAVVIDPWTYQSRYLERSPLNRCALRDDLTRIYEAKPNLVVVDLDISPALWIEEKFPRSRTGKDQLGNCEPPSPSTDEAVCQRQLYCLIKRNTDDGVKTVLMEPFELIGEAATDSVAEWKKQMITLARVEFGDAQFPVHYGLVIKHYCREDSLAGRAYAATSSRSSNCGREGSGRREHEHINPNRYFVVTSVPLQSGKPNEGSFRDRLARALQGQQSTSTSPSKSPANSYQAVFFGAGFGEADTYITPLGELYGVDIHAASYLSLLAPTRVASDLAQLLIEFFFALVFGFFIARCWKRYLQGRFSDHAGQRLRAIQHVGWLVVAVVVLTSFFAVLAFWLLKHGLWLSPIPIAVGMLIDSFVSGSVRQAVHEGYHQRKLLIDRLKRHFSEGTFLLGIHQESKQKPPVITNLADSLQRFLYKDWLDLYGRAGWKFLFARRLLWWLIFGLAFWSIFLRRG